MMSQINALSKITRLFCYRICMAKEFRHQRGKFKKRKKGKKKYLEWRRLKGSQKGKREKGLFLVKIPNLD